MNDLRAEDGHNYGIDALRLFSAFLVVLLHVLGQGGVIDGARGASWYVAFLIYVPAYCAVNCFAIISGYVGYSDPPRRHRYARYMVLWLQIVFYNLLFLGIFWLINPQIRGLKSLANALMPVTFNTYWYFTAYTGVFFLSPWLNILVAKSSRAQLKKLMLTLFLLFSCYATLVRLFADPLLLKGGYSFLGLAILYVVGAWMKKEDIPGRASGRRAAFWGGVLILCTWLSGFLFPAVAVRIFGRGERLARLLMAYCSPTIVGIAIVYVICFARLRLGGRAKRVLRFLSPAAFGAFLAHGNPLVFQALIVGRFHAIGSAPAWLLPLLAWGISLCIFALCAAVDKLRARLFDLAGVPGFCDRIEVRIRALADGLLFPNR